MIFLLVRFIFEFLSLLAVTLQSPFWAQCSNLMANCAGGRDGRWSKISFDFFLLRYTIHYNHINVYIYQKNCPDKFLAGLKSWGSGWKISKTSSRVDFFKIDSLRQHPWGYFWDRISSEYFYLFEQILKDFWY